MRPPAAPADRFAAVYAELKRLAAGQLAREAPGHTLQPTALVHEAFLRLRGEPKASAGVGPDRAFFAAAAEAMRRILVDHARKRKAQKRGGGQALSPLDENAIAVPDRAEELLALNEALENLAAEKPEHAELVKLRYFAGLTMPEAAEALAVSLSTAEKRWAYARAWLYRRLHGRETPNS